MKQTLNGSLPPPKSILKPWSSAVTCTLKVIPSFVALLCFYEGVSMDGKASTAISAFRTQDVSMALALNHGNVSVKPTGVASSVTKVC